MSYLICKHYYTGNDNKLKSAIDFDIFKDYEELIACVVLKYSLLCKKKDIPYDDSNIKIFRCGTINQFGEFNILSNPLEIYLNEIKENKNND